MIFMVYDANYVHAKPAADNIKMTYSGKILQNISIVRVLCSTYLVT